MQVKEELTRGLEKRASLCAAPGVPLGKVGGYLQREEVSQAVVDEGEGKAGEQFSLLNLSLESSSKTNLLE